MSILEQLERDLLHAAERKLATRDITPPPRVASRARRLRLPALAVLLLLATTTIALAASGVILTGKPVKPEEALNPGVGEGVPEPGATKLLSLRANDPAGGLPWGMRIVRTTRGEVCVQIGRVQDGKLGVLGIDGAFKDDGRFHPIPADALPRDVYHGHPFDEVASETSSCQLAGQAVAGGHIGVDRSADANAPVWKMPLSQLRDVYYGVLGESAVSVSYHIGHSSPTQQVLSPIGAYLIVVRTSAGQQAGYGSASLGTEGQLAPSQPLSRITYRLDGKLCERGPSLPPGTTLHLVNPCPQPSYPTSHPQTRDLHRPLRVRLQIRHKMVAAAQLSFVAPYAVSSAREDYTIRVPTTCHLSPAEVRGGSLESLARNVKAGATVRISLPDPFASECSQRTATIEVLYGPTFGAKVIVGSIIIHRPSGTRPTPISQPPRRRAR